MNGNASLVEVLAVIDQPGKTLFAALLVVLGLLYLGFAERLIAIRAWWTKRTIGADFVPSERTVLMYRIFGVLVVMTGVALYAGIL